MNELLISQLSKNFIEIDFTKFNSPQENTDILVP